MRSVVLYFLKGTTGMPVVNIQLAGEVSTEQKVELSKEITDSIERITGKPKQYIYIRFEPTPRDSWAIAGKLLEDKKA